LIKNAFKYAKMDYKRCDLRKSGKINEFQLSLTVFTAMISLILSLSILILALTKQLANNIH